MSTHSAEKRGPSRARVFFLLAFILYVWGEDLYDLAQGMWEEYQLKEEWPEFAALYVQGREALEEDQPSVALISLEKAVALTVERPDFRGHFLVRLLAMKAEAHLKLWQYVEAEQALERAIENATPAQQQEIRSLLSQVQEVLERSEKERGERTEYTASPGMGPSGFLAGKVVLAYVFVDDGKESEWSNRTRQMVLSNMAEVERWYGMWAKRYGVEEPKFVPRVFVYDRDPLLRNAFEQLLKRDLQTGYDVAARVVELQGGETVNSFLHQLQEEEGADQAMLLLHVNKTARSYALRCSYGCWSEAEYAFLFQGSRYNDWDALSYAQAHEGLHLFGADDLYDIETARDYAVRDVMNHLPRYLREARVDSITAYAIGWLDEKPDTPFGINEGGVHPAEIDRAGINH